MFHTDSFDNILDNQMQPMAQSDLDDPTGFSMFHQNPFELGLLNDFDNDMGLNPFAFQGFGNGFSDMAENDMQVHEMSDKYVVKMKDVGGIEGKEFKIDFTKDINQLTVTMIKKTVSGSGANQSVSSSSSQKSVSFEKQVDPNNITSTIENDSLVITVPKSENFMLATNSGHNHIEGIGANRNDFEQSGYIEDVEDAESI